MTINLFPWLNIVAICLNMIAFIVAYRQSTRWVIAVTAAIIMGNILVIIDKL